MEKTGKYKERMCYVLHVDPMLTYALISYNQDKSRAFKVELKDLSDLNFVPQKPEEGLPH